MRCSRLNSTETVSSHPSVNESDTAAERGTSSAGLASSVMTSSRSSLSASTISISWIQSVFSGSEYSVSTVMSEKGTLVSMTDLFSPPAPGTMIDEFANAMRASMSAFCLM